MSEPTNAPAEPTQEPTGTPPTTSTPPWGSDENFDPNRAWTLIENLRAEKEKLAARPALTAEQQQQLTEYQRLVEASQTEQERQANALAAAQRQAEQAQAEAIRYRAAATYGIPAEHFDLLGTGTEQEISARAEKLRTLLAAPPAALASTAPQTRPVAQLRPGATPGETQNEDDVLYQRLFGS